MKSNWLPLCALALLLAIVSHFLFSHLGYNPTDDGFILSYARRIADGGIPHRDFISIRPLGSGLLWAPLVLLVRGLGGSDWLFLISRGIVWLQWATICLSWVYIARLHQKLALAVGVLVVSFALTVHDFPVTAWHTTDGIFFCSLGTALAIGLQPQWRWAAALLIGCSIVCKQNFAAYALLVPFVLPELKRRDVLLILAPFVAYVATVSLLGGSSDLIEQLRSQSSIRESGISLYVHNTPFKVGIICGILAFIAPFFSRAFAMIVATLCLASLLSPTYIGIGPFLLLGCVLGALLHESWHKRFEPVALLALALAWSAGISMGYETPACGVAALVAALFTLSEAPIAQSKAAGILSKKATPRFARLWSFAICPLAMLVLFYVREHRIYRDKPASELNSPVNLPGLRGIYTNVTTSNMNAELESCVAKCGGHPFAILPDYPGYWAASQHKNPLPIDWPLHDELNRASTFARTFNAVQNLRPGAIVIVQRYQINSIIKGKLPLDPVQYSIVSSIHHNYQRVWHGHYFEMWKRTG